MKEVIEHEKGKIEVDGQMYAPVEPKKDWRDAVLEEPYWGNRVEKNDELETSGCLLVKSCGSGTCSRVLMKTVIKFKGWFWIEESYKGMLFTFDFMSKPSYKQMKEALNE